MKTKVPLSVIIPVLNEAQNLQRALRSISWADEVFVVDSGSADGSQSIAEGSGAKVVQFKFNGTWPKKKNWALDNLPLKHEWVFIMDADEELPAGAEEEFRGISAGKNAFDGYFINRRFLFMGKWLRHAYYPNWNLRLFRHRLGRYERLSDHPTDSGDVEIHEHVVLKGKTGYLKSEMLHYAFPTAETFVNKHNRYSNWEARVATEKKCPRHRKIKTIFKHLPFRPFLRFLYVYVLQRGFLDGREGFYFARLHAFYEFLSACKTYELKKKVSKK